MNAKEIGRLWEMAMESFSATERHCLSPSAEKQTWMFIYCFIRPLLRKIRKSRGLFPKPPGLEELCREARSHLC